MRLIEPAKRLLVKLAHPSFYLLLLCSLFAGSMLAARFYYSRQLTYRFLAWNLFLAWLPYLFSALASYADRRRLGWGLLLAALLWLLFFPNAPYILTDFVNLAPRDPIPFWYDVLLVVVFAWTGLFLALMSLSTMHAIVARRGGWVAGWLFVLATLALSSLGIYLGRFLRWNSWDVFTNPMAILADVGARLTHPLAHRQTYAVIILFSAFLLIAYLMLASARARRID